MVSSTRNLPAGRDDTKEHKGHNPAASGGMLFVIPRGLCVTFFSQSRRVMRMCIALILTVGGFIHPLHSQTLSSVIAFEERVHDFGTILEKNGKVSHTFLFRNNGKTPVTVNDIQSGCGCIGNIISKGEVKPGEKGKVTITFNPDYKAGFFSKEIAVYSNNSQNLNRIWVQGVVTPAEHPIEDDYPYNFGAGLYLRLKVMAFGYIKPGETKQMQLHYANDTKKDMTLKFLVKGNKTGLTFSSPGIIKAKQRGVIDFSFTMPQSGNDDVVFKLHPYVNNKRLAETLDIRILNGNKSKQNGTAKHTN